MLPVLGYFIKGILYLFLLGIFGQFLIQMASYASDPFTRNVMPIAIIVVYWITVSIWFLGFLYFGIYKRIKNGSN